MGQLTFTEETFLGAETSATFPGPISGRFPPENGSSPEGFPVRESAAPTPEGPDLPIIGPVFSTRLLEQFAVYDPTTSSWKMLITSSDPPGEKKSRSDTPSSRRLPNSGTMLNGTLYRRETFVRRSSDTACTSENAGGLLPGVTDWIRSWAIPRATDRKAGTSGKNFSPNMLDQIRAWATPARQNTNGVDRRNDPRNGTLLHTAVQKFLPWGTPLARDLKDSPDFLTWQDVPVNGYLGRQIPSFADTTGQRAYFRLLLTSIHLWLMGYPSDWRSSRRETQLFPP